MSMVSHPSADLELTHARAEVGLGGGTTEDETEPHFAADRVAPALGLDIGQ